MSVQRFFGRFHSSSQISIHLESLNQLPLVFFEMKLSHVPDTVEVDTKNTFLFDSTD